MKPTEHKTVQARILEYAEAIHLREGYGGQVGWKFVPQKEAEQRRGFDPETPLKDRAKGRTLFFEDLLNAKVREFNPRYARRGLCLENFGICTRTFTATGNSWSTCETGGNSSTTRRSASGT